jgi:hypothetical protein
MGSVRQVVALHKDRTVMPLTMVVQKLCGIGNDAIFMSVLRPAVESDPSLVKVWITNAGGAAGCYGAWCHALMARYSMLAALDCEEHSSAKRNQQQCSASCTEK